MQGGNLLKRRGVEAQVEVWSCRPKRLCLEAELHVSECPMETSYDVTVTNQQQKQQWVRSSPDRLCCAAPGVLEENRVTSATSWDTETPPPDMTPPPSDFCLSS